MPTCMTEGQMRASSTGQTNLVGQESTGGNRE